MSLWTPAEKKILKTLSTPAKIQDFVNTLEYKVHGNNQRTRSPRVVLRDKQAQCIEGAIFAAAALRRLGFEPLLLDLEATSDDWDHVVAVFKVDNGWGAISKTNHGVLRYREPVYKNIHELVMSYFHEYFLQTTRVKTLRSYAGPVNLARFDQRQWETTEDDILFVAMHLAEIPHTPILTRSQVKRLRPADPIELEMGRLTDWPE